MQVDLIVRSTDLLETCLDSVEANTLREQYRLIVVDDQNTEASLIEKRADICIRHVKPQELSVLVNHGMAVAVQDNYAPYILLLDSEARIPVGDRSWLVRMIAELEQNAQCAAVGATSNEANMPQHILTAPQSYVKNWQNQDGKRVGYGGNPSIPWVFSFALLLRKSVVAQCGFFDTRYTSKNYADIDYSLQLRVAGYKLGVARSVFVHRSTKPINEDQEGKDYHKWIDKWGAGRLFDLKVLPADRLQVSLSGVR